MSIPSREAVRVYTVEPAGARGSLPLSQTSNQQLIAKSFEYQTNAPFALFTVLFLATAKHG